MNQWQGRRAAVRGGAEAGIGEHLFDRLDAGNRLLRKREPERDCPKQFPVDKDGTAAHPLEDTGLGERASTEFRENDGLFGSDIFENAEDFDLELFDLIPLEDSATDAMQPRTDVFEGKEVLTAAGQSDEKQ